MHRTQVEGWARRRGMQPRRTWLPNHVDETRCVGGPSGSVSQGGSPPTKMSPAEREKKGGGRGCRLWIRSSSSPSNEVNFSPQNKREDRP
mmetsp:Transcript_111811/g.194075  ORF Transcript_111811/g.194075 Transcript_111811/m.194075 type:complete len:90 (+) Transcript_111811:387-656(+)